MSKLESSSIVATITTLGQTLLGLEARPDHTLGHCIMETGDWGLYVVLFQLRGGNSGKKSMVQVSKKYLSIYLSIVVSIRYLPTSCLTDDVGTLWRTNLV